MVKLNSQQQLAVDTIEGPVMVIAGAGTGKTQVIAARIANILKKTQTPAGSILCLTFTDAAATNMRDRLLSLIGPTAYAVKIFTFHGFCNEVILTHPDYFIFAPDAKNLDELERIQILQELIEKLPDSSPLKPWGDHFYYQRDLSSSIQTLKRENITPEKLQSLIDDEKIFLEKSASIFSQIKSLRASKKLESELLSLTSQLPSNPLITYHLSLFSQGGYDVGAAKSSAVNFKNALLKFFDNLAKDIPKHLDLLKIYSEYQSALQTRGRYDFDDMILFVLNSFQKHPELLLEYQEKFQYILVDEYQDTNSSQDKIIQLLGSYFDNPNIFVVGDDDQSIFRFQGAAIENIYNFYQKYHPKVIVLKNNYRSHQLILDSSASVISRNQNRLAVYIKDIDKSLTATKTIDSNPINLIALNSPLEENYYVASKIKDLIAAGTTPSEIVVLYRHNADVVDLCEILNNLNIKFYLPADSDILKSPPIIQLIKLLEYIQNPNLSQNLFHILNSDFIGINSQDLLKIFQNDKSSLKPNTQIKLRNFDRRLAKSRKWLENLTLERFFNKVIRRFRYLDYALKSKDPQIISQLLTFYDELKRLSREENYNLSDFLNRLQQLSFNHLSLPSPQLSADTSDSIKLMTVHKAKGLEFEHVFLIKVIDKKWGNNREMSTLRLPAGILKNEITTYLNDPNEEERRLFYVALTRAKSQIYISYTGTPSQFIFEIDPTKIEKISPPTNSYQQAILTTFSTPPTIQDNQQYLNDYLKNHYKFSVTHLNSYLRCPWCFYHQTILRLPAVKDKFSSFGTAIHHALSLLYSKKINLSSVLEDYQKSLLREGLSKVDFDESLARGISTLTQYFDHYINDISVNNIVDFDFKNDEVHLNDIPLTGKIDLIEIGKNNSVKVVDFKTGNPDSKYKELSPDGDYFRQLVFYKLLATLDSNFKYKVEKGIIDFVQPSKLKGTFIRKEFDFTPEQVEKLKLQITEVYQKILSLDFHHLGPDCKDHLGIHYLLTPPALRATSP